MSASGTAAAESASPAAAVAAADDDHPHVDSSTVHYHDSPFLTPHHSTEDSQPVSRSALIVLNSPIARPPSAVFQHLWDLASLRVCADGGANRLYESTFGLLGKGPDNSQNSSLASGHKRPPGYYVPDLIKGDLDSLRDDVRVHYNDLGCTIERDPDQDTNDLDKALQSVVAFRDDEQRSRVAVKAKRRRDKRDHALDAAATADAGPASPARAGDGGNDADDAGAERHWPPLQRRCGGGDGAPSTAASAQSAATAAAAADELRVYIYGAFGGRFDQEMASMQALYRWGDEFKYRIVLYGDETCAFLLPAGVTNEIRLPATAIAATTGSAAVDTNVDSDAPSTAGNDNSDELENGGGEDKHVIPIGEGPTCGLIPLGERCEFVRTTGLKWNLEGEVALEFGGLVSTSNRIVDHVVTVQSSHPLIFTTEMMC